MNNTQSQGENLELCNPDGVTGVNSEVAQMRSSQYSRYTLEKMGFQPSAHGRG